MELSDRIIIEEIRKGNKAVFETLFKNYYSSLIQFAYRFVFDRAICEDLIQDVFTTLWEKRAETDIHSLKWYLYTAIKNKCLTYIRNLNVKDKHQVMIIDAHLTIQEEDDLDDPELSRHVKEAIEQLPLEMKKIFQLKYVHGLKVADIAEDLDISPSTVKTQLARARQRLRQLLFDRTALLFFL